LAISLAVAVIALSLASFELGIEAVTSLFFYFSAMVVGLIVATIIGHFVGLEWL